MQKCGMRTLATLQAIALTILFTCPCFAGQFWQPGFRTYGNWATTPEMRLDMNIWYPAMRTAQEITINPWKIRGALNAKPAAGLFPLLVISHPSPAGRFSYASLAAWLASRGFVIIAPVHSQDNMDNMEDLFTWAQLKTRVKEIGRAITLVMADADLSPVIDSGRIGLIGFGAGGTAALLLGGALPNCNAWPKYCSNRNDVYCRAYAMEQIANSCKSFPLTSSLADPRIKALAVISPGFGMLFDAASFKYLYPPVLLAVAGRDHFNNPALHGEYLARLLGKKALYLDLPKADEGALLDPCPPVIAEDLPELCHSVTEAQRQALRSLLQTELYAFFSHYLQDAANLPDIPPPPNLEPAPIEQPKPDLRPVRRKRSAR